MPQLDTILATTDPSRASYAAVRRAAHIAKARGAAIVLLHVLPQGVLGEAWHWLKRSSLIGSEQIQAGAQAQLQDWAGRLYLEVGLTPDVVVVEGTPASEIVSQAARLSADLIVIGAHGAHALLDLFVGTTAQKVLQLAARPILLVKQTPPFPYERVLLPTDFSEPSHQAVQLARAWFGSADMFLFHGFELYYEGALHYTGVTEELIEAYRSEGAQHLRQELDRFARANGLDLAACRVRLGHPPTRIIEYAREIDADLIVVGSHGRSGGEAFLLGSVASHVIAESHCDVLLVKGSAAPTEGAG